MKTLLLMRHAESSRDMPGQNDLNRPLTAKGISMTNKVIGFLREQECIPDLIITSPAVRALETARLVAEGMGLAPARMQVNRTIYEADHNDLEELFYDISPSTDTLLLVGHNPGLTDFVNLFLDVPVGSLPTSGLVCLGSDIKEWDRIMEKKAKLHFIFFPELMK